MYEILLLKEASRNLEKLDKVVARRIFRKLNWLAENAGSMQSQGLRGGLAGWLKIREGDYRVVYQIRPDEEIIVVRFIGHRSDVYKRK